jgi:hypothetical protein
MVSGIPCLRTYSSKSNWTWSKDVGIPWFIVVIVLYRCVVLCCDVMYFMCGVSE